MKQGEVIKQNMWPTNFKKRIDQEYEELLDFEGKRIAIHGENLDRLIELASLASQQGSRMNACILASTDKLRPVSFGLDNTGGDDRSLSHAVMESLSKHAENLILSESDPVKTEPSLSGSATLGKKPPSEELEEDYVPKKPGLKQTSKNEGSQMLQLKGHAAITSKLKPELIPQESLEGATNYLASGLTVYTFQEPCSRRF